MTGVTHFPQVASAAYEIQRKHFYCVTFTAGRSSGRTTKSECLCVFGTLPKCVHFWLQNRELKAPCLAPVLWAVQFLSMLLCCVWIWWLTGHSAEQEEDNLFFSVVERLLLVLLSGTEQGWVYFAEFYVKLRLSLFWKNAQVFPFLLLYSLCFWTKIQEYLPAGKNRWKVVLISFPTIFGVNMASLLGLLTECNVGQS